MAAGPVGSATIERGKSAIERGEVAVVTLAGGGRQPLDDRRRRRQGGQSVRVDRWPASELPGDSFRQDEEEPGPQRASDPPCGDDELPHSCGDRAAL